MASNSRLNKKIKNRSVWPWLLAAAALIAVGFSIRGGLFQQGSQGIEDRPSATAESDLAGEIRDKSAPQGATSNSGWEVVDPASVDELPGYKEVVPGRALVRVLDAMNHWAAGDEVVLNIPQRNAEFNGVIERVEQDTHGNRTYLGILRDLGGKGYRFVITVGPRNTFAHIGTASGTFELVATGGRLGWLMPTLHMDQHVDYSQPDYYVEEEPRPMDDDPAS